MTITDSEVMFSTTGGCGLVALAVLQIIGGKPVLWKDLDDNAIHAAVRFNGQLIHLGSRESGYEVVSTDELERAIREDFSNDDDDENREIARKIAKKITSDF